jgi:pSer/pThr/pTyr-binding forkhead associated (FHA) protein
MANLLITTGEQAGKHFPLANRTLSAGRDAARDIQILDPKVSRKHFLVRRSGDDYVLAPVKSLNGVLVNGNEIADEVVLKDRDKIELGDTTLRFRAGDDPDRTNALEAYKLADRSAREDRTINDRS